MEDKSSTTDGGALKRGRADFIEETHSFFDGLKGSLRDLEQAGALHGLDWQDLFLQIDLESCTGHRLSQNANKALQVASGAVKMGGDRDRDTQIGPLTQFLADASRKEIWRLPFGISGILSAYLSLLSDEKRLQAIWVPHALRLLSNCCVDLEQLEIPNSNVSLISKELPISKLLPLLLDKISYKPCLFLLSQVGELLASFQEQRGAQEAVKQLLQLLNCPWFDDDQALDTVLEMLRWSSFEEALVQSGVEGIRSLLRGSRNPDLSIDNAVMITDLMSHILDKSEIDLRTLPLLEMLTFLRHIDPELPRTSGEKNEIENLKTASDKEVEVEDEDGDIESLVNSCKAFINELAKMAAGADFTLHFPVDSPEIQTLISWLSLSQSQIRICALVMIGNIAYASEQTSTYFTEDTVLGRELITILTDVSDGLVLRSALETAQILAKAGGNRERLGQRGILEAISHLWSQQVDVQLCATGLHHTRYMLHGSPPNAYRFVTKGTSIEESLISRLLSVFKNLKDKNVRLQCALCVNETLYTLFTRSRALDAGDRNAPDANKAYGQHLATADLKQSGTKGDPVQPAQSRGSNETRGFPFNEALIQLYHAHPDIVVPFLEILEAENQSLTTRAWFTLALMSDQKEGADRLYATLIEGSGSEMFKKTLLNEDESKTKDVSNARVLLRELMKHYDTETSRTEILTQLWKSSLSIAPNKGSLSNS